MILKTSEADIYEVILQSYLFLGYPKALEGLKIFREIFADNSGVSGIDYDYNNWQKWKNRGKNLCRKVYGRNFDRLIERVGELSPELSEWMVVEGYGKVLSRGVISGMVRELCTVSALVVTSDLNQLHSHMRGAVNMGADKVMIKEAVMIAGEFASEANFNSGLRLFEKIFEE